MLKEKEKIKRYVTFSTCFTVGLRSNFKTLSTSVTLHSRIHGQGNERKCFFLLLFFLKNNQKCFRRDMKIKQDRNSLGRAVNFSLSGRARVSATLPLAVSVTLAETSSHASLRKLWTFRISSRLVLIGACWINYVGGFPLRMNARRLAVSPISSVSCVVRRTSSAKVDESLSVRTIRTISRKSLSRIGENDERTTRLGRLLFSF